MIISGILFIIFASISCFAWIMYFITKSQEEE